MTKLKASLFLGFFAALLAHAEATPPSAVVFARPLHQTELFETLTYPARVTPKINTTVLAEADGVVSKLYAPLGTRVRRGEKLLRISHTDPVYQYAPVLALSPVTGVVSGIEVTEGTQVVKGQKLASVTDPTQLKLTVEIPSLDLPYFQKTLEGTFELSGATESHPIKTRLSGLSPFVDPATGTATAELTLSRADAKTLAPGMTGLLTFKAGAHPGFAVPEYAVIYKGAETYVRVVENGKAKQVLVTCGRKSRGEIEITKGLYENANLIERSSRFVADGEAVTVQSADEKPKQ